eukprot:XP_028355983.1 uncharacterized protein LOC114487833 [Physeter catodon]
MGPRLTAKVAVDMLASANTRQTAAMLVMRIRSVLPHRGPSSAYFRSDTATSVLQNHIFGHAYRWRGLRFFCRHVNLAGTSDWKHNEDGHFQLTGSEKSVPTRALPIQPSTRQKSACGVTHWLSTTAEVVTKEGHAVHLAGKYPFCIGRFFYTSLAHASSESTTQLIRHRREQPARVRVRGLPFRACPKDVADFFAGYQLAGSPEEAVQLQRGLNGRPSGYAFVYFATEAEARRARDEKNRCYLGERFIEIFVDAETGEMEWLYQKELSENVNRKQHGKDNR